MCKAWSTESHLFTITPISFRVVCNLRTWRKLPSWADMFVNFKGAFNDPHGWSLARIPTAPWRRHLLDHVANLLTGYLITLTLHKRPGQQLSWIVSWQCYYYSINLSHSLKPITQSTWSFFLINTHRLSSKKFSIAEQYGGSRVLQY